MTSPSWLSAIVSSALALSLSPALSADLAQRVPDPGPPVPSEASADSVLVISVDGLNPDALRRLGPRRTPVMHRLRDEGASTMNARTQVELTLTLPNHTGMVTGRRIEAADGGHGVTWNDERREPRTVQAAARRRIESVFTGINDAGGSSAVFASKTKFSLWRRSWPKALDRLTITEDNRRLVSQLAEDLREEERDLRFLHLSAPDVAGHTHGFMGKRYLASVRRVDRWVGRALQALAAADPQGRTAVVLTSDHGGSGDSHGRTSVRANYRVPFMVRGPGVPAGVDLYDLNTEYADPGPAQVPYGAERQPVRNGAVANLVLDLLGLPPVPGSEHDAAQDLDVVAR